MEHTRIDLDLKDFDMDFLQEEEEQHVHKKGFYKVMVADDDVETHRVTEMILKPFEFEGKGITLIHTYSARETCKALVEHPDTAVLFLDVVMEENDAGLTVVEYLRNELKNSMTRILLRTGQPGEAPEDKVIRDYDINDYRLKTEMTVQRLNTSLFSALRSYRDIMRLERNKRGLEKMIKTSADMFKNNSMNEFLNSILSQISSFYEDDLELVYARENTEEVTTDNRGGFVASNNKRKFTIVAAKGHFEKYIGSNMEEIGEMADIYKQMSGDLDPNARVLFVDKGFIVRQINNSPIKNFIFVEGAHDDFRLDLINLFLSNYSLALDNFYMDLMISETQREIIYSLGDVIETHYEETSDHVARVTNMMYLFAQKVGLSSTECEFAKVASALHDTGKIGIPDHILKKPGKLTPEEFEVMKKHAVIGHLIFKRSKLELLQLAAEIAHHHHERYDGTGYPDGLKGEEISIYSRMMAIIDNFDAMTHKRVYKGAISVEETLAYIASQRGTMFDPRLTDLFLENIDEFLASECN